MNLNTTIQNNQFGIILLEGEPTIIGQIEARKKALKYCMDDYKEAKKYMHLNPAFYNASLLKGWIENHKHQISILESLIN
jgi:hypothetical protein